MKAERNVTVSMTDANQNFAQVAYLAEHNGHVVIMKNNRPKYLVVDLDVEPQIKMTEDEKFMFVAERFLREHRAAFEAFARND